MTSNSRAPRPAGGPRALLVFALVMGASAWADDAAPPVPPAPPVDATASPAPGEIVVFGDLEVARKRQAVINDLRQLGYKDGKRKDGYTLFRPESPWKPSVRVYDDITLLLILEVAVSASLDVPTAA